MLQVCFLPDYFWIGEREKIKSFFGSLSLFLRCGLSCLWFFFKYFLCMLHYERRYANCIYKSIVFGFYVRGGECSCVLLLVYVERAIVLVSCLCRT